jgi:iron(III) transport system permease protein
MSVDTLPEVLAEPAPTPSVRSTRRSVRLPGPRFWVALALIGVTVYLVIGPLLMLIVASLQDTGLGVKISGPITWTHENFATVFGSSDTYSVLGTTAVYCFGSLLLAFVVAILLAWLVERTDMPARGFFYIMVVAPAGVPALISAIAWAMLINPTNGVLNEMVRNLFNLGDGQGPFDAYRLGTMIMVQGIALVPVTFLLMAAAFRGISGSLEEASRMSGLGFLRTIWHVTLPLLKPALVGALVYQFVTVIAAIDIPLILGLPANTLVFSSSIYTSAHPPSGLPNYGLTATYGLFLLLLSLVPILVYNKILGKSDSFVTVTGKSRRSQPMSLRRWKPVAVIFASGYAVISFLLPFAMLVWVSIQPYLTSVNMTALRRSTLSGYKDTLTSPLFHEALTNTIVAGVATALFAMTLSVYLSWFIVRTRSRGRWAVEALAFLPHAIPGVVIGLSTILVYLALPVGLYGTVWIIVVAMGTMYISLGTRTTTAGMIQIQASLEEAASMSGANDWQVWRYVLLPMLRPVFMNGMLLVFLAAIHNLTLPLMLYSGTNLMLSSLIYSRFDNGYVNSAVVLSVIMTVIAVTAAILMRRSSANQDRV